MAGPILLETNPGNNSSGIPVGQSISLSFNKTVDVSTVNEFIVLFGADYDQTSGADSVLYVDKDTGDNPFFLRSPGFTGLVELKYRFAYYDLDTGLDIPAASSVFYSPTDETSYGTAGAGSRVYLTPSTGALGADLLYTLHVLGDPDTQGTGVSSRTVYDTEPNSGNTGDGSVIALGGYVGPIADTLNIEVTAAGDIGTARYKWWLDSEGESAAARDKLTNRKYRTLRSDIGVQVRFAGQSFAVGDTYTVELVPAERMAASTKVMFTTNDGSYSEPPDSPSVPAASEPPASTVPSLPGATTGDDYLQVLEMIPADSAFNVSKKTNQVVVLFSEQLEASSITQDSVRVYRVPALGWFEGQREPIEMAKRLTVDGQLLTIQFA